MIVYGPTPPEGVMITDPFVPPLQDTLVTAVVAVIGVACVSILVSWLNYLTVEKPMIAFGLRFRSQALNAVTLQPSLRGQGAE